MPAPPRRPLPPPLVWIPLLAAALAPAGCGGEAEPADSSASFGHLETLTVEPELRIDGSEHVLVPIRWIGVGGDGSVALMQTQDATLRLFDREGNEMGTVGGQGEGPGEFTRPIRGGWKGDSMWVSDMGLRRVSVLTPEGEFARAVSPPNAVEPAPEDADRLPAFSFITPHALYPGDTMLVSGQWSDGDPLAERMEGLPVLLRVSAEGVIDRVVREVPRSEGSITITTQGITAAAPVPFFPGPHWTVSPDGQRIATLTTHPSGTDEGTLHLRVVDALGEELVDRSMPFDPIPIPDHVADSAVAASAERAALPELRRIIERDARGRMSPVYPPVHTLLIGADHRIWLGLRETNEGVPWVVLGADGEPEARLVLPPNQTLHAPDAEHVWVTERDEVDVESVLRLSVGGR